MGPTRASQILLVARRAEMVNQDRADWATVAARPRGDGGLASRELEVERYRRTSTVGAIIQQMTAPRGIPSTAWPSLKPVHKPRAALANREP
jgi:hypothetical protein